MRARCKSCRSYGVKITPTASRKTFIFTCANPSCRTTYARTLGIAADILTIGELRRRRRLHQAETSRMNRGTGEWELTAGGDE